MTNLPEIDIGAEYAERCRLFGEARVRSYAEGRSERSRQFSRDGIDKNPLEQARGQAGEVAAALFLGLDPNVVLNWNPDKADDGTDFIYQNWRVDVKASKYFTAKLLWPYAKTGIYDKKKFDVFILVTGGQRIFTIHGWITKTDFKTRKQIASKDDGTKLHPGTWYVEAKDLTPMKPRPSTKTIQHDLNQSSTISAV
jgi:hypothetical protein